MVHKLQNCDLDIFSIAFSGDEEIIAGAGDNKNIYVWKVDTGDLLEVLSGHQGRIRKLEVFVIENKEDETKEYHLISVSEDAEIKNWILQDLDSMVKVNNIGHRKASPII